MKRLFAADPHLGIEGLPDRLTVLMRGRLHIVAASDDVAPNLALGTVAAHLSRGHLVTLISPQPQAQLDTAARIGWRAAEAAHQQRLVLIEQQPDWALRLETAGTRRLLGEIATLMPKHCTLIVEAASALLAARSAPELRRHLGLWREFLLTTRSRALWLVPSITEPLRAASDDLGGVARLWQEDGTWWWEALRWRTQMLIPEENRARLLCDERGQWFVAGEGGTADYEQFIPADQRKVIATAGAIAEERGVPSEWTIVPDHAAAIQAMENAIAATVLLEGGAQLDLAMLMYTVHTLRVRRGRRIKILVREKGGRLRYSQEWVLLNLGANQVLSADIGFSRVLSLIESLVGQRYTGEIVHNFEAALLAAEPIAECGYLPPATFCARVSDACQRARAVGLANTLVRLPLRPGTDHLHTLRAFHAKRPGDVATVDADSLYLFLFACREPDVEDTLARLFVAPLAELFEGQLRWHDNLSIERTVAQLAEQQARAPSPDFSSQLPPAASASARPPAAPLADPVDHPADYRLLPLWQATPAPELRPRDVRPSPLPTKRGTKK